MTAAAARRTPEIVELTHPDSILVARVAPALGGEMISLVLKSSLGDRELLHRGGDLTPTQEWTGRAPLLWPAVGRNYPADRPPPTAETFRRTPMGWTHGGRTYPLNIHGFARDLPWEIEGRDEASVDLVLHDGPATRAAYPFAFRFRLRYALKEGEIELRHQIRANPGNVEVMPFSIGNHITFRLPLLSDGDPGRTTISTPANRELMTDATGRPTGDSRSARFRNPVPLADLEPLAVYALAGYGPAPPAADLRDPNGLAIRLSHVADRLPDGDPVLFNFWGDLSQRFFSPEPWVGKQNSLATGDGVIRLAPGETFRWTLTVAVEDER